MPLSKSVAFTNILQKMNLSMEYFQDENSIITIKSDQFDSVGKNINIKSPTLELQKNIQIDSATVNASSNDRRNGTEQLELEDWLDEVL